MDELSAACNDDLDEISCESVIVKNSVEKPVVLSMILPLLVSTATRGSMMELVITEGSDMVNDPAPSTAATAKTADVVCDMTVVVLAALAIVLGCGLDGRCASFQGAWDYDGRVWREGGLAPWTERTIFREWRGHCTLEKVAYAMSYIVLPSCLVCLRMLYAHGKLQEPSPEFIA